jgi:hypothetical protein
MEALKRHSIQAHDGAVRAVVNAKVPELSVYDARTTYERYMSGAGSRLRAEYITGLVGA